MRVSTVQQYESTIGNIREAQSRFLEAQQRVMTGKRINKLSDDPSGGSFVLHAKSLKAATEQYDRNLRAAQDYLGFSESTLSDLSDLMKRAYQLSVQAANSATEQFGRQAMIAEVDQLQKRLIELANTKGGSGQYIFAGQKTNAQPFSLSGSTLSYNGDSNDVMVEIAPAQTMGVTSKMGTTLTDAYEFLESFKTNLTGGNLGGISGVDIQNFQNSMNAIGSERGSVGAKLRTVDELKAHNQRRIDDFTQRISDVEDVDMAEAITQYQTAQTVYTAALQVASTTHQLSLMDFIRG